MSSVPQVSHGDIGTYNLDGRVPIGQLAGGEFHCRMNAIICSLPNWGPTKKNMIYLAVEKAIIAPERG